MLALNLIEIYFRAGFAYFPAEFAPHGILLIVYQEVLSNTIIAKIFGCLQNLDFLTFCEELLLQTLINRYVFYLQ